MDHQQLEKKMDAKYLQQNLMTKIVFTISF